LLEFISGTARDRQKPEIMSPSRARKQQARFNPFLASLLVILAMIGAVATLDLSGATDTGLLKLFERHEVHAETNMVPVLLPTKMLEPGHMVGRADLWDAQAQRLRTIPMDKSFAQKNHFATGLNVVNGRVMARPKSPNEPFLLEDFLPIGTPPGLVGLVPPGMRLVPVPAASVKGLEALRFGDHFDLYVADATNSEMIATAKKVLKTREHVSDADLLRLAQAEKSLEQRLLVQNGAVLRPTSGSKSKNREVAVALHPDDVEPLLAALDEDGTIYCIARSAAEAKNTERVQVTAPDPMREFAWLYEGHQDVEFFNGNERSVISVPIMSKP